MHIFRHSRRQEHVRSLLAALKEAVEENSADQGLRRLLAMARLECALADAWSEPADDWESGRTTLVSLTQWMARCSLDPHAASPTWPALAAILAPLAPRIGGLVPVSEPEGFRFHGVFPASYAAAARAWQGSERRAPAWVLGLRTIGSTLAPVVAANLCGREIRLATLRPRGDSQDRRLRISTRMAKALGAWRGMFLIVDEGPGLSGSSFGGAVRLLRSLGIEARRIVLFPSWDCDGANLTSEFAARHWHEWRRMPAPAAAAPPGTADCSGGSWRQVLRRHRRIPVWPQQERPKYLDGDILWKFSGLADYGRRTHARGLRLAGAGFGPPIADPEAGSGAGGQGWIGWRRVGCRPLPDRFDDPTGRRFAAFAGRYLAWVSSEFGTKERRGPSGQLEEMVAVNQQRLKLRLLLPPAPEGPIVELDARMCRHEWGWRRQDLGEFVKFDATDHGDDAFFPGPADIAWDLAALQVEFGSAIGAAVREVYRRQSGEPRRELEARVAWHVEAYAIFRAAYCRFVSTQVGGADAVGFQTGAARYLRVAARCGGPVAFRGLVPADGLTG